MISSASSSDRAGRPEPVSPPAETGTKRVAPRPDRIATEQAAFLRAELGRQPEVRAEVVERARRLAADPQYPGPQVIKEVAGQILHSPDPSEYDA